MKKQKKFQEKIKKNRKLLKSIGFDDATLTLWSQGKTIPRRHHALRLVEVLSIDINSIPIRVRTSTIR